VLRSPRKLAAGALPALALAMVLCACPGAAAENREEEAPARPLDSKPEKSDNQAAPASGKKADGADGKTADEAPGKPAGKPDQKPEGEGGAEAESQSEDPCDPKKQLVQSDLRNQLCKAGLKFGITETEEVLGNPTGGRHQGVIYEGLTDLNLRLDLRPTLHVRGEIFARAYQIHGRGLTTTIGSLNEISGIEAAATTRLNELWYEQHFDHWLRVRIGQQTIGTEFLSPGAARLFVNGAFGWPTLPSLDLPSGGPGYPLGTPALRVRIDPMEGLKLFVGLFNGDPTGAGVGGSQLADASGTAFRINDGAFLITELRYNPENSDKNGTYAVGGWWNSERFRDLHVDTNGISLASPFSNGQPRQHATDFSLFASINQPLPIGGAENPALSLFARAMGAPGDRNLIDLYVDGGLAYKGPFGRTDDQVGIAVGYARVGSAARALDADTARFTGISYPVRSGETVLEVTYQFQLTPWWQLQPDFQYVFSPGGGLPSQNAPARRVGGAAVLGLRTAITF
jgi:porin